MQIVQNSGELRTLVQIDRGLLEGFANRRLGERSVTAFLATTRKRNLSAPRITFVYRSLDEKNLWLVSVAEADEDCDRRPPSGWICDFDRRM